MSGSGSGPLGLLLMIAPLAAIPVFAVMGIPQFAPLSASQSDDAIEWNETVSPSVDTPAAPASRDRFADDESGTRNEFRSRGSRPDPRTSRSSDPADAEMTAPPSRPKSWLPPPDALDHWDVPPAAESSAANSRPRSKGARPKPAASREADDGLISMDGFDPDVLAATAPAKPARNVRPPVDAPASGRSPKQAGSQRKAGFEPPPGMAAGSPPMNPSLSEPAGWDVATRRLKALGIRKYRLDSHVEEQNIVFVCNVASPDNPRVAHRFETEGETPLEAVQAALRQIEDWRGRDNGGDEADIDP
jgi:hypothetical protein